MLAPVSDLKRPFRWTFPSAFIALVSGGASIGLTWAQSRWYAFHPHYLPLLALFAILSGSAVVALVCGLPWMIVGPCRRKAAAMTTLALLPVAVWAFIGLTARANWGHRHVPNSLSMRLAKVMGATFMRLETDLTYPHRLQTGRLVMCYGVLEHPEQDLAAMDQHLVDLERMLGGPLQARVFWVRGDLPHLGVGWLSVHGIALASRDSPPNWAGDAGSGDRHELAHAALDHFRTPGCDPPYLLHEGWAVAQSESGGAPALARSALGVRAKEPSLRLRDLFTPHWYYADHGPVYSIGGAFVDFLIRTRGAVPFRRFYNECRLDRVDALCRELFDADLDSLDAEFWEDATRQAGEQDTAPANDGR